MATTPPQETMDDTWQTQGDTAARQQAYQGLDPDAPLDVPSRPHSVIGRGPAPNQFAATAVTGSVHDANRFRDGAPARFTLDQPPFWDGRDPEKQADPFLKLLQAWLLTTQTLKTQRGILILQAVKDDLRLIINELDMEDLTHEDSGQKVFEHVKATYK